MRCLCTVHYLLSTLLQAWSCISPSGKRSSLIWGTQVAKSCFPVQWINLGSPWLHPMQMQISICELNHFPGLYTKSIRYLLTKTWRLLHWWTLALENLDHNSQLNWFAGMGHYMPSVFKMESKFPVPLSFTLGSPLSLNNQVWHHSGWTPVSYLEQSTSFSQSISRVMDLWALIWRSLLMQICLLQGRNWICGSCVLHTTPSQSWGFWQSSGSSIQREIFLEETLQFEYIRKKIFPDLFLPTTQPISLYSHNSINNA